MIGDEAGAIALDGPAWDIEWIYESQNRGFGAREAAEQAQRPAQYRLFKKVQEIPI